MRARWASGAPLNKGKVQPLVDNSGLGTGDTLNIQQNCLSESDPDIKTLKDRGVQVFYQPQGCTP